MPLLSVTIPTYRRADRLSELLWGLCRQIEQLPDELRAQVDIWVNDNASFEVDGRNLTRDCVEKYQTQYPFIQYACNDSNLGADRNVGVAMARPQGQFIWLMCDDDLPTQGAIKRLLEHIERLNTAEQAGGKRVNLIHSNSYHRTVAMDARIVDRMYVDYEDIGLMPGKEFAKKFHMALLRASTLILRKGTYDGPFVEKYLVGYLCSPLVMVLQCLSTPKGSPAVYGSYIDDPLLTYRENHKPWWGIWPLVVTYYIPLIAFLAVKAGLFSSDLISPFLYQDRDAVRKYIYQLKKSPPEQFSTEPGRDWHLSFWMIFRLYARRLWFWEETVLFCLLPHKVLRWCLRYTPYPNHLPTPSVAWQYWKYRRQRNEPLQAKVFRAARAATSFANLERSVT
jgi:glycosyltransferase involved in cell wall biosynthesis